MAVVETSKLEILVFARILLLYFNIELLHVTSQANFKCQKAANLTRLLFMSPYFNIIDIVKNAMFSDICVICPESAVE